jgi:hypothetical protein
MKFRIIIVSKLSATIFGVLLLAPLLGGARAQGLRNPKPGITKALTQNQLDELAHAQDKYQFYTINPEGALGGYMSSINDSRLATGVWWNAVNAYTFLWQNGQQIPVTYPGSSVTLMGNVNNADIVFGNFGSPTVQTAATLKLATGTWTLLPDITNKPINYGMRMNDFGIGVGTACDETLTECLGWTWDGKAYSFTTIPGTSLSTEGPQGINDRGEEAGSFQDDLGNIHAYLLVHSELTQIDMPGAVTTYGLDINNNGEILLQGILADGSYKNGTWREGAFTPLPAAPGGATSTLAYGLNDNGDYCGSWTDTSGVTHLFVAFRK